MKRIHNARQYAVTLARDTSEKAWKQRCAALEAYPPSKHFEETIRESILRLDVCGYSPLSNLTIELFSVELLMKLMLKHLDRNRRDRSLRYAFFTMTVDAGFYFENAPDVDVAKLQLSAGRLLRKLKLNGIGCLDVTILRNKLPGEKYRRLILHIHGIVWTRDPDLKWKAEARRLSRSRHYPNMLGVPSISFVTRREAAAKVKAWRASGSSTIQGLEPTSDDPRSINSRSAAKPPIRWPF